MEQMGSLEEECPVCKGEICNPSQPTQCCNKVFCQNCLSQSLQHRPHCPCCRSPLSTTNPASNTPPVQPPNRSMPFNFGRVRSRPIGSNLQNIIGQLRNAQTEATNQVTSPNQAAPQNPSPRPSNPLIRPVPAPRLRRPRLNLGANSLFRIPPTPAQDSLLPSPAPIQGMLRAVIDDLERLRDLTLQEVNQQLAGSALRIFECPFCQQNGFDELQLRDHCNNHHSSDSRRVVCPVCVATPHGDSQYFSQDFIVHLNLRHCYYMEDFTNLQQTDDMNLQCAILESFKSNM